ncbi:hypothetical protein D3C80_1575810 [compost metagenome]
MVPVCRSLIRYRPWFSDLSIPPWTSSRKERRSLGVQSIRARAPLRSASPRLSPVTRLRCQAPPCSVETARRPRTVAASGPETWPSARNWFWLPHSVIRPADNSSVGRLVTKLMAPPVVLRP